MPSRKISDCAQELQDLWEKALPIWVKNNPNYLPVLTCTYRSPEEQTKLYNQPFDKIDNDRDGLVDERDEKVTNAPAGRSKHNVYPSKALDFAFYDQNTRRYNWDIRLFIKFSKILKAINPNIIYGGDWKMKDFCHIETK